MSPLTRLLSPFVSLFLVIGGLVVVAAPAQAGTEVYPAPASGAWTADGRAFGHGRGMSQWGSQAAALQGRSTDEILTFYYPGTTAASLASPYVKTSLVRYSPTASVTIWNPAGSPVPDQVRMGPLFGESMHTAGRWTVTASDQQVTAERRAVVNGPVLETVTVTGVLRLESLAEYGMVVAPDQTATTGRWYRGDLRIEPTGGAGFNVTNSLPMEQYLRSVVPRESPASWQSAALRAQAIAARSYAWHKVTNGSVLCDTTLCQVYYGRADADVAGNLTASWEDPRSDSAIAATSNRVQNWGSAVALTEFSSSNGGWTTASSLPYQVARSDPWTGTAPGDTVTAWTSTLQVSSVAKSCPGTGGVLRNLVVLGRTGNGAYGGRVTQARVECTTGNATIGTPAFGLRSSWWVLRAVTPALNQPAQSATVIDHGAQVSLAATPSVAMNWTLTVRDRRSGLVVLARTGAANPGERFNATWFGDYAPQVAGAPYVGAGVYDLELSAAADSGATAAPYRTSVEVRPAPDPARVTSVPLVANGGYMAVAPTRLVDTRPSFQSLGAGQRTDVPVTGVAGVPSSGVTAVVLNVTAVGATGETHLRIWPAGADMPGASVVNSGAGRTQASLVTVGIGGEGKVSVYNAGGTTNYLVDVVGYYTTALDTSSRYASVEPVRAFDSRTGAKIADGATRQIDVATSLGRSAAEVSAVTVNITTTQSDGFGYVVAYGSGSIPATSSVNLDPATNVANRAIVPVVNGQITVAAKGSASHVIVDIVGWYAGAGVAGGATFSPVQPARLLDTRPGSAFGPAETRTVGVAGASAPAAAVPAAATAIVGTLTATGQSEPFTHARVWPAGQSLTPTSDLNSGRGRTQANAVVPQVGAGGAVQLYNDRGTSHLILDVTGYFS